MDNSYTGGASASICLFFKLSTVVLEWHYVILTLYPKSFTTALAHKSDDWGF